MSYQGEYSSVWDDGVEVVSEVEVDLEQMRIIAFGERWLAGECDGYDIDTVDDEVENLISEYVYIPELGAVYSACQADNVFECDDDYGNGIILYD